MATAKPEKPDPAASEDAAKPKPKSKSKKLLLIIAVLILGAAGGAGWYFTKASPPTVEAKAEPVQPKFITLESFTVNLQRETGDQFLQVGLTLKIVEPDQQSRPNLEEKIKLSMLEIRSRLLLLLSGKYPSELASAEGKKKLAQEIIAEINIVLGLRSASASPAPALEPAGHEGDKSGAASGVESAPVTAHGDEKKDGIVDVLFTSFIIQ